MVELDLMPMDDSRYPRALATLRQGVESGVAPGFVLALWKASSPERYEAQAVGRRRIVPSVQEMAIETPFDLASVSKVYATATLAARLIDRGWIDWTTPLQAMIPQFSDSRVTIEHLLAHTAGLPAWLPLYERLRDRFAPSPIHEVSVELRQRAMRELVLAAPLEAEPGAVAVYSDLSFLLLGFALEEVTSLPLDAAVERFVWAPLGIESSVYRRTTRSASAGADERYAATELCPWRGAMVQGQVHDDNCWTMGGYGGHAGVLAPASDLMLFAARMLGGFLSPGVLSRAWTPVRPPMGPLGCSRTPGWDTPSGDEPAFSKRFSQRSVGHLGFTGTSLWIDSTRGLAVALLSNRVHPSRENILIRSFRNQLHAALADDLGA